MITFQTSAVSYLSSFPYPNQLAFQPNPLQTLRLLRLSVSASKWRPQSTRPRFARFRTKPHPTRLAPSQPVKMIYPVHNNPAATLLTAAADRTYMRLATRNCSSFRGDTRVDC